MDYQIVHAVEGRIRIRIPLLAEEAEYGSKLQKRIESLNYVTNVRINPLAESIIVTYKYKFVSCPVMQTHLQEAIAQVASPQSQSTSGASSEPKIAQVVSPQSSSPPPTAELAVEEKAPEVSTGVAQESFAYNVEQVNLDKDPWEEETTSAIESPNDEIPTDLSPLEVSAIENEQAKDELVNIESPNDEIPTDLSPLEVSAIENEQAKDELVDIEPPNDEIPTDLSALEVSAIENEQAKDELVDTVTQQVNIDVTPLQTSALARRLGVHPKALSRYKSKPDFSQWSQKKDPNNIAWTYDSISKIFYPTGLTISTNQSNPQAQRIQTKAEIENEAPSGLVGGIIGEVMLPEEGGVMGKDIGEQISSAVTERLEEEVGVNSEHSEQESAQN